MYLVKKKNTTNTKSVNSLKKQTRKILVYLYIIIKDNIMKKQGYNARLDESLGAKNGKKKQSLKSRRDESKGMEKAMGKKAYSGNKSSAQGCYHSNNVKVVKHDHLK
tara:strand:+ start:643 stop:963 length:321 start_codon:yes stop_codon:yes gene_type:complete